MNNTEFEKSKIELEKQKEFNNKEIEINDERTRMSKVNNLEYQGGLTFMFSMIAFVIISFIIAGVTPSVITNIFPGFTFPVALISSSLGIGTLTRYLFDKKYDVKKRFKSFSNAKTQSEKLEDEIRYKIELEKSINRNKAIDKTIKLMESNQEMLNKISTQYKLDDKTAPNSKEEAQQKEKELSSIINEQYNKLDILTTQNVLHETFWKVRQNFQRRNDTMAASMLSGIFTMGGCALPALMFRDIMPTGSLLATLSIPLAPLVTGMVAGNLYMLKRNKDYKKVFNKLNDELAENSLEENLNRKYEDAYDEKQELNFLIEKQIRDISLTGVQQQENRRYLETYTMEERKNKMNNLVKKQDILFQDFPNLKITEETRKSILKYPNHAFDARTSMGKFYTNEEKQQYIEESLKRPLPGEEGPTLLKRRNTKK